MKGLLLQILSVFAVLTVCTAPHVYAGFLCERAVGSTQTASEKAKELMSQVAEAESASAYYVKTQVEAVELLPIKAETFNEYYEYMQASSDQLRVAKAKKDLAEVAKIESTLNELISTFAMSISTPDIKDSGKSMKLYQQLKEKLRLKGSIGRSDILEAFITIELIDSMTAALVWSKALKFSSAFDTIGFLSRRLSHSKKKREDLIEQRKKAKLSGKKEQLDREIKLILDEIVVTMESITHQYYFSNVAVEFSNMNPDFRP